MQSLLQLLQELEVPTSKSTIVIVPRERSEEQDDSYQLQLEIEN